MKGRWALCTSRKWKIILFIDKETKYHDAINSTQRSISNINTYYKANSLHDTNQAINGPVEQIQKA